MFCPIRTRFLISILSSSLLFSDSHEIASKAEEADWHENKRNEDYILISGLDDETPGGLNLKEQVESKLRELMGKTKTIWVTDVSKVTEHLYEVKLANSGLANEVRQKFAKLYPYQVDHKRFNIKNKVCTDNVQCSSKHLVQFLFLASSSSHNLIFLNDNNPWRSVI